MNRAMYSGVAGLKTHQTRMDVIGNNIANVNTVGYKSQSALFSELLYQNSSNASGPNPTTNIGGINPKQVGLGVKMASISTNITLPGSAETTNNPFDIRITGEAFLIVNNGKDNMFTRDGSFKVDAAGNLVMSSNGYKVMGWQPDPDNPNEIKPDTVSALQIMNAANMTYPPEATTQAYVSGIVDAESPEVNSKDGKLMNLNFYDARGYSYTAKLAIKRVGDSNGTVNSYSCELVKLLDGTGNDVTATAGAKMMGAQTSLQEDKTISVPDGYSLVPDTANNAFILRTSDVTGTYKEYTITNGNITAKHFTGTHAAGTETDPQPEMDPWAEVAEILGYPKDVSGLQSMTYTVPADAAAPDPAAPFAGQTLSVSARLYDILTAQGVDTGAATPQKDITFNGQYVNGCVIDFDKDGGAFKGINGNAQATTSVLSFGDAGVAAAAGATLDAASFREITIDFSTLSNVGNEKVSTASATNGSLQNLGGGRMVGKMSGLSIGTEGKIYAAYDNGQTKLLGQIATARFANPSGLQKEGDNLYIATQNSGDFDGIGVDVTSDGGKMTPGELEMSNVDLSGELTGMIVTQRGFQANSRIITVSDTMLEELINLKR